MKKTLFFGLIAASLGFTACSSEDDAVLGENTQKKGMVLNATVEQPAETRAKLTASEDNYVFAFEDADKIKVSNSAVTSGTYYTFTNDGTTFASTDATATSSAADWYAYFPSNHISLDNQPGTLEGVANLYALAGKTASATTGADGLNITLSAKVAILKIVNVKGNIAIQAKTSATEYVTGLTATVVNGNAGFTVETSTTATSLFTTTTTGTYYVAVPAGIKLAIKDGNNKLKSTKVDGLTAGKYYNLTVSTTGTAKATISETEVDVNWVQLWDGGPKFAEYNVGVTDGKAESYGGYYSWGGNVDLVGKTGTPAYNTGTEALTGDNDTATKLWGSKWRMPKKEELEALYNASNCTKTWKTINGVKGYEFKGKSGTPYVNNSVFLPAADYCYDGVHVYAPGSDGYYWSSTPKDDNAHYLRFDSSNASMYNSNRKRGHSVRAVLAEN